MFTEKPKWDPENLANSLLSWRPFVETILVNQPALFFKCSKGHKNSYPVLKEYLH